MKRKSVSYLNSLTHELANVTHEVQQEFDNLDDKVFEVTNLDCERLRNTSHQDVRATVQVVRNQIKELQDKLELWKAAAIKYQTFF